MILVIDNYDSFTYNLVQYIGEFGEDLIVRRNDKTTLEEIEKLAPQKIVISPGPGTPSQAGITLDVIKRFHQSIPILGVCLGHQAIGEAFGGRVIAAPKLMHGKTSEVFHDGRTIFSRTENPILAMRYHSLIVDRNGLPDCLEVSATTRDGIIMGLRHKSFPVEGVQFHPEAIMTQEGKKILSNFINPGLQVRESVNKITREYLSKLQASKHFSEAEASEALDVLLTEDLTDAQIAALLLGFAFKGETAEEIAGFARVMRQHAVKLRTKQKDLIDTAGTGGGTNTFNISTTAAFVIAGAGLPVAKHGNVAITSRCGSADVLKELGVKIEIPVETVENCLDEIGMAFLFAPRFHPAMKKVGAVRRQLGIKTAFNILGPLTNPAGATFQIIGVFQAGLTELMAEVLRRLGTKRAWVFHSMDGMDEISICDETKVTELKDGKSTTFYLSPRDLGLELADKQELAGADSRYNAEITRGVLYGDIKTAPRTVVLLNAAAGLFVSGRAQDLKAAMEMAKESIDSGAALKKLEALRKLTNSTK